MVVMAKNSKISLESTFSEKDMADFDDMLNQSLETNIEDVADVDDEIDTDANESCHECADVDLFGTKSSKNMIKNGHLDANSLVKEKSLEDKLNDIYNEYLQDTTITLANIKDISFREAAIKGRWCSRLMAERVRCRRLTQTLEALMKELTEMASSQGVPKSYLNAKMQRDNVINSNAEVVNLRREISESKEIQDFLSKLYECIKGLGYTVKNSLDILNLERGV